MAEGIYRQPEFFRVRRQRWIPTAAAPPEVPQTIAGLHLWLAADKITGLSNGAAVTQWNDFSGFSNHAAQGTALNQPSYQTNIVNGLPVVRFDGSSDRLVMTNADILAMTNNAAGCTIMAVVIASASGDGSTRNVFGLANGATTTVRVKHGQRFTAGPNTTNWSVSGRRLDADTQQNLISAVTPTYATPVVLGTVVDWANSNADVYLNGSNVASTAAWFVDGNTSATNSLAAAVGAQASETEFWFGDIAELIVYNSALNSTDRQTVETYLNNKYGFAAPVSGTATGIAAQGSGQNETGVATGSALIVGTAAQGSGQAEAGAATGGALAVGVAGQGSGQVEAGTATTATPVIVTGVAAQGSGQVEAGAASGAANATGRAAQGSGQVEFGVGAGGGTAAGASRNGSGQTEAGAATGGAAAVGVAGQSTGQVSAGVTAAEAVTVGGTVQGSGQTLAGAASGGALYVGGSDTYGDVYGDTYDSGPSAQSSGQVGQGTASTADVAIAAGRAAQGSGQVQAGAATATANPTVAGSAAQGSGQVGSGAATGSATVTGVAAQSSGQIERGTPSTADVVFAAGRAAQGSGQVETGGRTASANITGVAAQGSGQVSAGNLPVINAAAVGRALQGSGDVTNGLGLSGAIAVGIGGQSSGQVGTGRIQATTVAFGFAAQSTGQVTTGVPFGEAPPVVNDPQLYIPPNLSALFIQPNKSALQIQANQATLVID